MPTLIALLLLVLAATPLGLAQDSLAQAHAKLGISLAKAGNLGDAERELRQAVQLAPSVASFRAQLGSILGLQGKWTEALKNFQSAVNLAPDNLDFRRETAAVQWQLGLIPEAEKNVRYVLDKHPDDPGASLLLGLVKEKAGDYRAAAELLDAQFDLATAQPDRAIALFHSALESHQEGKVARVIDALSRRSQDPQWANAVARCTEIAAKSGDLGTSQSLFVLIPENDAHRPAAGILLAKLLYTHNLSTQAKDLLLQLIQQGVVSPDLQTLLGNCYEAEHQPRLALEAYFHAIEADPSRVESYEDPVSFLLESGKSADARKLIDKALVVAPNDPKPWIWKGNASLRTHAYADSIQSYMHAGSLDSSNADAVLGVAAVYFASGQNDAAIVEYKRGITKFPKDARFYVGCATMLLGSPESPNLLEEAKNMLQKAVQLDPQSTEAHYQYGQLAMQQNRLKDAEAELLLSLKESPNRSKTHFALSVVYRRMGRTYDAGKQFAIYQDLKRAEEIGTTTAMAPLENP